MTISTTRIDRVIGQLDRIVADSRARDDRFGFFASMYKRVTMRVKEWIAEGRFEDAERIDLLDAVFAQRYFDALDAYRAGRPVTRAWRLAFDAACSRRPTLIQHLLLGMNAHINLDLGIAAAAISSPNTIGALKGDYMKVNDLLGSMVDTVQDRVAVVSPWMGMLDRLGARVDETVTSGVIRIAREDAWHAALRIAATGDAQESRRFEAELDDTVARIGARIRRPDPLTRAALTLIHRRELKRPSAIIDVMESGEFWGGG